MAAWFLALSKASHTRVSEGSGRLIIYQRGFSKV